MAASVVPSENVTEIRPPVSIPYCGVISALGWYIALQCSMYLSVTLLLYPVAVLFGGVRLRQFAAGIFPAQAVAASTQSSLASLPAMIDSARSRLGQPAQPTQQIGPRRRQLAEPVVDERAIGRPRPA
jgi:hypothetical protein